MRLSGRGVGVLFYDLLADDPATDLRASALLEGLGLLGLAGAWGSARCPFSRGTSGPGETLLRPLALVVSGITHPRSAGGRGRPFPIPGVDTRRPAIRALALRALAPIRVPLIRAVLVGVAFVAPPAFFRPGGARGGAVRTARTGGTLRLQSEMAADAVLVLGGDVLVVVEARGILDVVLGLRDLDGLIRLVHPGDVHGDQG